MQQNGDPFWVNDISILYRDGRIYDLVPNKTHKTMMEEYNAFTRLVLIYGSIVSLYKQDPSYFVWALAMVILVSVFVNHKSRVIVKPQHTNIDIDTFEPKPKCRLRTMQNPYGNLIHQDTHNHLDVCPLDNDDTGGILPDFPLDEWDVYGKNTPQRAFYRQPNVNIINDQTGYAKWLYGRD